MIQLAGQQELAVAADRIRSRLQKIPFIVRCIPDLTRVEHSGARDARVVVRPGFSFLRGEMTILVQREDAPDQERLCWRLEMRGIGSSAQARVVAQVESLGEQLSRLHYEVTIEQVGGLLRAVHSSLLQAAMQQTVQRFLRQMEEQCAAPADDE
ncbi:MAG: SRPBCC domain-containing protein [Gemmatales bacterium]|nr:SRPBCC domain-containing protein [Gemmatales bacterium]MDW8174746.1 SRPBCC domain-containing protein [Gemmatales bacterium]